MVDQMICEMFWAEITRPGHDWGWPAATRSHWFILVQNLSRVSMLSMARLNSEWLCDAGCRWHPTTTSWRYCIFTLFKLYFENFWKINDLWIWIASWMSPGVIFDPFHLTKDRTNFKMVWLISVTHWPTRSEITISFINSAGYLDSEVVFTHWEP